MRSRYELASGMVRTAGLEPARGFPQGILSPSIIAKNSYFTGLFDHPSESV
jgi:hypothetical protein